MPEYAGFSPRPQPRLIANFKTLGPAVAVSKGLDRDRAVDEGGNQLAVFGRRGARPFNLAEMQRMYMKDGQPYAVSDAPTTPARDFKAATAGKARTAGEPASPSEGSPNGSGAAGQGLVKSAFVRLPSAAALGFVGACALAAGLGWRSLRRRRRARR
jgi:hypothetical protein